MYEIISHDYGSPRWTGEVTDCSMPMTFDTYSNCGFGCCYCFSQFQRAIGKTKVNYLAKKVKAVNVERIKNMFLHPDDTQFGPYIKQRKVMQWGGLSDPFCWIEKEHGVTLELLKFFKDIDYPLCFSTKGVWWLDDKRYTDLFRNQKNWNVKVSIITLDPQKARYVEKGVVSPQERIEGLRKITELNCGGATLRLRPFIIGVTNPTHIELINQSARAGATAMTTEFFCLERRAVNSAKKNYKDITKACGFDIVDFYSKHSKGAGYLRLNRNIKEKFILEMKEAAEKNNMRFYVSDAHFKELCNNGCCCGLPPDWNYSKGKFTHALLLAKKNGTVKWSDISGENLFLKDINFNKAAGFNTTSTKRRLKYGSCTLRDYLRSVWNDLKHAQNPYRYFGGILQPLELDENNDIVYIYQKEKK